tara:strand:- start:2724 stop:3266 length:543 start_codon:yes stop_codon:yes gene_type:complete
MRETLFVGSWQKVLIKVILLLLVLFVVYRVIKNLIKLKPDKSISQINNYIENELPNTIPPDNSSSNDPETITNSEADLIANNLKSAMGGNGTNESAMFSALQCLNGASLNKVYASFGARDYDGSMLDLFGWFGNELSNSLFVSAIWYTDCVPECSGYWDQCHDLEYMQQIWSKSSIPISF